MLRSEARTKQKPHQAANAWGNVGRIHPTSCLGILRYTERAVEPPCFFQQPEANAKMLAYAGYLWLQQPVKGVTFSKQAHTIARKSAMERPAATSTCKMNQQVQFTWSSSHVVYFFPLESAQSFTLSSTSSPPTFMRRGLVGKLVFLGSDTMLLSTPVCLKGGTL